jgi:hypothetical protein
MRINSALWIILVLAVMTGCAPDDSNPSKPVIRADGQIAIINIGDDPLIVADYYHIRGEQQAHEFLGVRVSSEETFRFDNLLEPAEGNEFRGGDEVKITYTSDAREDDNRSLTLFQRSLELTIDGSRTIAVNGSMVFTRYPD